MSLEAVGGARADQALALKRFAPLGLCRRWFVGAMVRALQGRLEGPYPGRVKGRARGDEGHQIPTRKSEWKRARLCVGCCVSRHSANSRLHIITKLAARRRETRRSLRFELSASRNGIARLQPKRRVHNRLQAARSHSRPCGACHGACWRPSTYLAGPSLRTTAMRIFFSKFPDIH